ncbi:MAG: hypothetical protein KDD02_01025 [Phaeodactylibacter sp.]|nr:hypothetical protein [Phaeodactylibacter sp.]MCB9301576.1 hypothetical protein [Lewinellaceae bacterium]
MRQYWLFAFILFSSFFVFTPARAQQSSGGKPISFSDTFQERYATQKVESVKTPRLNLKRILQEDADRGGSRFAAPLSVSYSLENSGVWTELEDGSLLWRLEITSEGALAIAALYDDFHLPPGAKLFMYSPDRQQLLGAYTFLNNSSSGRFLTGFIRGESAVFEYYEPKAVRGQGKFRIFRIDHVYQGENFRASQEELRAPSLIDFGFGTSFSCHKNANCPEGSGNSYEAQKRSTCRIIMTMEEGTVYCSGSLVNNTNEDGTPLVLSAYHCYQGYTPLYDLWRFDFGYQSVGCANPVEEPPFNSVLGCVFRSSRQPNDFLLLEATSPIPSAYNVYFSGWNRQATAPDSGFIFHHPRGDIKKISRFSQPAVINPTQLNWGNGITTPPNHHFRVVYSLGTFEPGSSGAPLFDQDGRLVGQLHGGIVNDNCAPTTTGYFGRFTLSWTGGGTPETRLSDWLDPLGLGVDTLGGMDQPAGGTASISGRVANEAGVPINGVKIYLSGPSTDSITTGPDGLFSFSGVPVGSPVAFALQKQDNYQNGLSTLDLLFISRHVLGVAPLDSPYKIVAADVNSTNNLTTLDQIGIRKVILGIDLAFPNRPAWLFFPELFSFTDPTNPFLDTLGNVWILSNFEGNVTGLDFIGIKSGDVDNSAGTGN